MGVGESRFAVAFNRLLLRVINGKRTGDAIQILAVHRLPGALKYSGNTIHVSDSSSAESRACITDCMAWKDI